MGSKSIGSASFFIKAYAVIQLLFALTLFGGGAYLIILNGSWYYCITGLLLVISSIYLIYAELSGDFPLGDSRQPTYKSLRPFDLVS